MPREMRFVYNNQNLVITFHCDDDAFHVEKNHLQDFSRLQQRWWHHEGFLAQIRLPPVSFTVANP